MFERFDGRFSISRKLVALEPSTLTYKRDWLTANCATTGKESSTGMKYIALGRAQDFIPRDKPKLEEMVHEGRIRDTVLREYALRPTTYIKVYEDTSFWTADRWPLARITAQVERGHAMLTMLLERGSLPDEWDYWFSY